MRWLPSTRSGDARVRRSSTFTCKAAEPYRQKKMLAPHFHTFNNISAISAIHALNFAFKYPKLNQASLCGPSCSSCLRAQKRFAKAKRKIGQIAWTVATCLSGRQAQEPAEPYRQKKNAGSPFSHFQ